ncbi:YkvA family protein [Myroides sp. LJL115]
MNQDQSNKANQMFNSFKSKQVSEKDLEKAQKKAGNLGDKVGDFMVLLNMMKDTLSGKHSLGAKEIAIIGASILYVVSPIDAIPDIIPVLGWTDDMGVVGVAVASLGSALQTYKSKKGLR